MAEEILRRFAVGGAARPDSFSGLSPQFQSSLAGLFQAAPPEVQAQLRISSGYRSPERQAELWQAAVQKYGSEDAARKWVAPPGRSNHNKGAAVDLKYLSPAAQAWAHANAKQFGLAFPMKHEPWHIEPVDARGAPQTMVAAAPAAGPAAPGAPGAVPVPTLRASPFADVVPVQGADSSIAALFAASSAQTAQQRKAEQEAETARKQALFAGPSPFG